MKTRSIPPVAAIACSLTLAISTHGDPPFSERDARNNAAVAASPRAREAFPWLTRTAVAREYAASRPAELNNRAYAKSPRVLEVYPELTRTSSETAADAFVQTPELANRAFAASPRAKEAYPWLSLRSDLNPAK